MIRELLQTLRGLVDEFAFLVDSFWNWLLDAQASTWMWILAALSGLAFVSVVGQALDERSRRRRREGLEASQHPTTPRYLGDEDGEGAEIEPRELGDGDESELDRLVADRERLEEVREDAEAAFALRQRERFEQFEPALREVAFEATKHGVEVEFDDCGATFRVAARYLRVWVPNERPFGVEPLAEEFKAEAGRARRPLTETPLHYTPPDGGFFEFLAPEEAARTLRADLAKEIARDRH